MKRKDLAKHLKESTNEHLIKVKNKYNLLENRFDEMEKKVNKILAEKIVNSSSTNDTELMSIDDF